MNFLKKKNYKIKVSSKNNFSQEYSYYSPSDFKSKDNPLFIYLHGLPGAPVNELVFIPHILGEMGFDTICFNYPGMWSENGYFSSTDLFAGIYAILDHILQKVNPETVNLFGESFGGAVSLNLLGNDSSPIPINKIILRSAVLDFQPILNFLPATLLYLKQAGILNIHNINELLGDIKSLNPHQYYPTINQQKKTKIWGVIGKNDEVLPANEMIKAISNYPTIKVELWDNFPHNDIDDTLYDKFFKRVSQFMQT